MRGGLPRAEAEIGPVTSLVGEGGLMVGMTDRMARFKARMALETSKRVRMERRVLRLRTALAGQGYSVTGLARSIHVNAADVSNFLRKRPEKVSRKARKRIQAALVALGLRSHHQNYRLRIKAGHGIQGK